MNLFVNVCWSFIKFLRVLSALKSSPFTRKHSWDFHFYVIHLNCYIPLPRHIWS